MNSSFKPQQAPMERQANRLASQGRYGDSMMVHMNPTEVQVLNQMAPGGLTRNPQTGQPEAFGMLASIIASMITKAAAASAAAGAAAGGTAAASGAAGAAAGAAGAGKLATLGKMLSLGTMNPTVAGALASGTTTAIQTGDLMEGLKTGVIGGVTGHIAGKMMSGLGEGAGLGADAGSQITPEAGTVQNALALQGGPPVPGSALAGADGQAFAADLAPQPNIGDFDPISGQQWSGPGLVSNVTPPASDFSIGDAIGSMGITDVAIPAMQGMIADDAVAMYDYGGGDMEEEDEDPFYQEVRPSDRGIQMPGMGYDAGTSGEFDYFANPFKAIPVAKTGGHLRQFEEGGTVDKPINLSGLRGFDQITAPPSFDFSGTDIYGPAPVNMEDFNLSTPTTNAVDSGQSRFQQIAAQPTRTMPNLSNIGAGIGFGPGMDLASIGLEGAPGMIESYYPDYYSGAATYGPDPTLTAFGGRFAPDPVTPAASAVPAATASPEMSGMEDYGMPVEMGNQMFRNLGMEDFAMPVGMENQMGLNYGMESAMPSETFMPVSYGTVDDRGRQATGMQSLREAFGTANKPRRGGIGGRNPNYVEPVNTGPSVNAGGRLFDMPSVSGANIQPTFDPRTFTNAGGFDMAETGYVGGNGLDMSSISGANLNPYESIAQTPMYSPTTMPTRGAGYGGMGMNQDFRFMI